MSCCLNTFMEEITCVVLSTALNLKKRKTYITYYPNLKHDNKVKTTRLYICRVIMWIAYCVQFLIIIRYFITCGTFIRNGKVS